jgi:hypothetical protein
MNQGPIWARPVKKTRGQKSRLLYLQSVSQQFPSNLEKETVIARQWDLDHDVKENATPNTTFPNQSSSCGVHRLYCIFKIDLRNNGLNPK